MQYLHATRNLTLTLEPNVHPNWWVDSSFAVHPDMCSHSGIIMSLGKGAAYSTSCKQKLNRKNTAESELVAIDDTMGQILWTQHFLNAQGITTPEATTIFQDNKSTILLAESVKTSDSRCTPHLHVQYFFVTDNIKKGEVKVAFCPMHDMLGDFFTKPLQGSQFVCMMDNILNLPGSTSTTVHRSVLEKTNPGENFKISKRSQWDQPNKNSNFKVYR